MSWCVILSSSEGAAWIRTIVILVIVIVGWRVLIWNAKRMARRSEIRNLVDKTSELVRSVEAAAIDLWKRSDATAEFRRLDAIGLFANLQAVGAYIEILRKLGANVEGVIDVQFFDLLHHATFDVEDPSRSDVGQRIQEIAKSSRSLRIKLEEIFLQTYP